MRALVLVVVAACGKSPANGVHWVIDAREIDAPPVPVDIVAPIDAAPDSASAVTIDAHRCFGTAHWTVCLDGIPTSGVVLPHALDTDTDPLCAPAQPPEWTAAGQPDACFVVGGSIEPSDTHVTGSRPLVLLATDQIYLNSLIDIASHHGGANGAAANFAACPTPARAPRDAPAGSAGGGAPGGSFGTLTTAPGNGGNGDAIANSGGTSGAQLAPSTMRLRGGCAGVNGGSGIADRGLGGAGGGAIYLVAGSKISGDGAINASGAGARAGGAASGGGGGGSGGMIVLFAPTIDITGAIIWANGGGGSSGGTASSPGNDGGDSGGVHSNAAGGAAVDATAGGGGASNNRGHDALAGTGGGGGGGDLGFILSNVDLGTMTSPDAWIGLQ